MTDFAKTDASRFDSPFLNAWIFLHPASARVREEGQSCIRHVPPSIRPLHSPPSGEMDAASSKLDEYFVSSVHSSQCDKQGSAPLLWTSHLLWSTAPLASSHTHGIDLTGCKEAEFGLSSLKTEFHQTYSMLCCYSTPEIGDQSARISPQCGGTSLISSGARP